MAIVCSQRQLVKRFWIAPWSHHVVGVHLTEKISIYSYRLFLEEPTLRFPLRLSHIHNFLFSNLDLWGYKPTEEGKIGEGTTPTPIGLPEKQPEPSTTAAPEK
ncbi:hypothetical protein OUZ56_017306 [Daphnia magna]|uniref:Uncharacterized protein n=1 Tax=Daphnia magna TaxID=35525 RepID=A0ABR0ASN3_9CRUS|nr:hypothetical protein OUZ56_017306 [Daphnia magna]